MLKKFIVILLFLLFSLGQLVRISFMGQEVNIYLYEISMVFIFGYLFLKFRFKPIVQTFKFVSIIIYFFGYLFLSFFIKIGNFNLNENIIAFLYLLRFSFYFLFFIYLIFELKKHVALVRIFKKGIFVCFILIVFFSFLQYFFYPDLRNLFYQGWDPHLYRIFGTFLEPVILSSLMGLFLLMFLLFPSLVKNRYLRTSAIAISFMIIILSFSRGVYFAVLVTLLIYLIKRNWRFIFIFLAVFAIVVFVIPKPSGEGVNLLRTSTIQSRLIDYSQAIGIWKKNPIFGIGYNRIRYVKPEVQLGNHASASFHSSFLIMLVTSGVVGLGLFLGVLGLLGRLGRFGFYGVVFLSVVSLFDNVLLHPFILFCFLIGIVYSRTNLFGGK